MLLVLWTLGTSLVGAGAPRATGQPRADSARDAYTRALALDQQGNHSGALGLLWYASGVAPHDPDIQNALGEALDRIGALDAAIDAFRRALADRPGFRKAANNLILTLVKAGNGEEAVARAKALLAEAPQDADRYFTLGLAQSEQDVDAAIATFRRALDTEPATYAGAATTWRSFSSAPIACPRRWRRSSARSRSSRAPRRSTRLA